MAFLPQIKVRVKPSVYGIRPDESALKNGVMRVNERTALLVVEADPSQLMTAFDAMVRHHAGLELTMEAGEWIVSYLPRFYPEEGPEDTNLNKLVETVTNYMNVARIKSGEEARPYAG